MSFSCECDNGPEFMTEDWHVARKEHLCCECGQIIQPGQRYERIVGKWAADVKTFATCERCADLREAYADLGYCAVFGELWTDHIEQLEAEGKTDTHAYAVARAVVETRRAAYQQRHAEGRP